MTSIASLPSVRSNTYHGVNYTVEHKNDSLFYWEFLASQIGFPIGETKIYGTGVTLQEAHERCKKRIDTLLSAAGNSVGTAAHA